MSADDFVREVYVSCAHHRLVIRVYAVPGDMAEAQETVQEGFAKALGRAGSLAAVDNPEAWLRAVASTHLRHRWRRAEVVRRPSGRPARHQVRRRHPKRGAALTTARADPRRPLPSSRSPKQGHPHTFPEDPMNPMSTLLLLTLVTATACAGGDDSTSAGEPTSSPSSVAATHYIYLGDAPEHAELTPGAYALAAYDSPTTPLFVLDVPNGYERFELLAVLSRLKAPNGDDRYAVGYWAPRGVYANACTGQGPAPDPGPTAKAVAAALSAQRGPHTTRPKPVTVDGHPGWYLELSVPPHADLSGCDAGDLDYFTAGTEGTRHTNTPGAVDRLYVVDVSGDVVIIDTGYTPQASAAQIDELHRMVQNGRFMEAR